MPEDTAAVLERGEGGRADAVGEPTDRKGTPATATPIAAQGTGHAVRSRLPGSLRDGIRRATWAYRVATSARRALPQLIIIGAQRAGTSSLYSYLIANPAIGRSHVKEVHYFDTHYQRGVLWYRAHFPIRGQLESIAEQLGTRTIAIEASPYYLSHPLVPHRVRGLLPQVKLVVLLRDPVDRALSHYHLSVQKGAEQLPVEEAIEIESERLSGEHERLSTVPLFNSESHRRFSYVTRGRYAEQLERWLAVFPRDQLMVLDSADLFAEPDRTLRRICDFAGVPHHPPPSYKLRARRSYPDYSSVRAQLRDRFAPHNERLWKLIGERFDWA